MDLWLSLFWTGPIGVGVFLAGLGRPASGVSPRYETRTSCSSHPAGRSEAPSTCEMRMTT